MLLSTKYKANTLEMENRRQEGVSVKKYNPDTINRYNKFKDGIDTSDEMLYYLDKRRPSKYWRKVTFYIISRVVLNSYILNKENNNGYLLTRFKFTTYS